jgi:hypothetical protein
MQQLNKGEDQHGDYPSNLLSLSSYSLADGRPQRGEDTEGGEREAI